MSEQQTHRSFVPRWAAITAVALGLAGGSYGLASAATGSSKATTTTQSSTGPPAAWPRRAWSGSDGARPWGGQRSDETALTAALSKVTAAAQAKVSGGTIVRVETDADGNAVYEAHMTDSAGAPVTVYVDKSFDVVSVERR